MHLQAAHAHANSACRCRARPALGMGAHRSTKEACRRSLLNTCTFKNHCIKACSVAACSGAPEVEHARVDARAVYMCARRRVSFMYLYGSGFVMGAHLCTKEACKRSRVNLSNILTIFLKNIHVVNVLLLTRHACCALARTHQSICVCPACSQPLVA